MFKPEGVNVALVTPFNKNGVDEKAYIRLIDFVREQKVDGIVPCGSTGEFSNMSFEEKRRAIEIAVENSEKLKVITGTGASGTDEAIEMTKTAGDLGADACLVVTPYYAKPTDKGLFEHFATLEERVELPIIMYNFPQATGVNLTWQVVEDLVELEGIVGIKDTSGNMSYFMTLLEKVSEKISVLCGWDEIVLPALACGADGCILASANVIGDFWRQIYDYVKSNDIEKAINVQRRIQKLTRLITSSGALGTKTALNYLGLKVGKTRKPLMIGGVLSYENREEIRIELEKLGKIKPKKFDMKEEKLRVSLKNIMIGEALCGFGTEVAHIDLILGSKKILGKIYAQALASPTEGREPLQAILEPNLIVKPETLIVPTVRIRSMRQASIIYGPVQAGIAKAVADENLSEDLLIIVNAFCHPVADNRKQVYINNYKATRHAIRRALEGRPSKKEIEEAKENARHPFRYSP
ncbi:MAG: 4-hydroxy-tetrahydrodipicolinate synthase [Candidatus Methanofastidiosia archaeon]